MDYDLDTEEGMKNAINWTNITLGHLADGGRWYVPRSGTIITVVDRLGKRCAIFSDSPDPSLMHVLGAAGWTFTIAIINTVEH